LETFTEETGHGYVSAVLWLRCDTVSGSKFCDVGSRVVCQWWIGKGYERSSLCL